MPSVSRKRFLVLAGASAGTLVAGCGGGDEEERAREARTAADLEIVRFLLTVERTSTALWEEVVRRNAVREIGAGELAGEVARNDREHVATLERYERRLGKGSSEPPRTDFAGIFAAGPEEILQAGAGLANISASAYLGQANRIQDRNLLASVLAIHSVEGRQAAALNDEAGRGTPSFPTGAFAEPLNMDQVRGQLERLAT